MFGCGTVYSLNIGGINIINIYSNSNIAIDQPLFNDLIENMNNQKIIIMGDFNSHHPLWDKTPTNTGGKNISDFFFKNELIVMNDGSHTLFQNTNNNSSAVDLTMISSQLALYCAWKVIYDCGNSNHFPTSLTYEINNNNFATCFINRYQLNNFKKADLDLFLRKF